MSNPVIRNTALVARERALAVAIPVVIDGSLLTSGMISGDGYLLRGTILVKQGSGKYKPFVHGTDTLAADGVVILVDDLKASTGGPDLVTNSGYYEGFFLLATLLDANSAGGLVSGDLTSAAGFHSVSANELRLK